MENFASFPSHYMLSTAVDCDRYFVSELSPLHVLLHSFVEVSAKMSFSFSLYEIIVTILQYAELKPVPCLTFSDAQNIRETCATPIQKQVI